VHLFITGIGSFIGQALVAACNRRGMRVSGIDARPIDRPDCRVADIRAANLAEFVPENIDAIVHLAAVSRDSDSRGKAAHCFDINVMGTLNVAEAARARRARKLVFASSEWVYEGSRSSGESTEDEPIDAAALRSEYALSKYVSEANLRQAFANGLCPATVLRFGIIYGPRPTNWSAVEALVHAAATQDEIRVGSTRTARRYIHVDDVADAILASLELPGFEIVNVQGPRLVSLGEIVELGAHLSGRSPRVVETQPATPSIRRVSDEKARRLLDWRARMGIEDGIRSLLPALGLADASPRARTAAQSRGAA
jgi:UDP-glucose 4-epimerase